VTKWPQHWPGPGLRLLALLAVLALALLAVLALAFCAMQTITEVHSVAETC
jgi:hypothetical protein